MALYRTLAPIIYEADDNEVIQVTLVGRILDLTDEQATLLAGSVLYVGNGAPLPPPEISVLGYDTLADFPNQGVPLQIYLALNTGAMYQWSEAEADYVLVDNHATRTSSVANVTSWTINVDTTDYAENTGLTAGVTINNPTGTPAPGQRLWTAVTGTASRAISYGTAFENSTVTRATTTSGTARLDMGFIWNSVTSKWRIVAVA